MQKTEPRTIALSLNGKPTTAAAGTTLGRLLDDQGIVRRMIAVEYNGVPIEVATSNRAWLVDDANRRSSEDTTGTDGRVSRRLRIAPAEFQPALAPIDSITVIATATYRGLPVTGSPVRIVIQLREFGLQ